MQTKIQNMNNSGSRTFMPTPSVTNYARQRSQAPTARGIEPSESESSIPSWLDRPRKTEAVILDGTRRVILEAHDCEGIQRQYVVSTAEEQSLRQADMSEKSGVIIKSKDDNPHLYSYNHASYNVLNRHFTQHCLWEMMLPSKTTVPKMKKQHTMMCQSLQL